MTLHYEDYDFELTREELIEALAHAICEREWYEYTILKAVGENSKYEINQNTVEFMVKRFELDYDKDIVDDYIDEIKDYVYEKYLR